MWRWDSCYEEHFCSPFFMLWRLPAWEESAWHEERKERCSRGKTAPALLDLKPQRCSWIVLPESGGGAKRLMVSDKNYHTLSWTPRGELFRNDNIYKSYWFPFSCCHPSFAHCNSVMLYKNFIKLDLTNRVWTQIKRRLQYSYFVLYKALILDN